MQKHHMHRFTMAELDTFNSSHIINKLAFGEGIPGVQNPLDGCVFEIFVFVTLTRKTPKGKQKLFEWIQKDICISSLSYQRNIRMPTVELCIQINSVLPNIPSLSTRTQPHFGNLAFISNTILHHTL